MMLSYLQKFNNLPKELRDKVSSSLVMDNVSFLEKKYKVDLAIIIMKVMAKDILFSDLKQYIINNLKLSEKNSLELVNELRDKVFNDVKVHLGISEEIINTRKFSDFDPSFPKRQTRSDDVEVRGDDYIFSPEDEEEIRKLTKKINGYSDIKNNVNTKNSIDAIIEEVGIDFGSSYLKQRFRDIISTCLRGVRDRIDVRLALGKSFKEGGLGFDTKTIDMVLRIIDKNSEKNIIKPAKPRPKISLPKEDQEIPNKKIDILKNAGARDADYNLKRVLEEKELNNKISQKSEIKDENILSSNKVVDESLIKKEEIAKDNIFENKKLDVEHELAPPPPKVIVKQKITSSKVSVQEPIQEKEEILINKTTKTKDKKQEKIAPPPPILQKPNSFSIFKRKKKEPELKNDFFDKEVKKKIDSKSNIPTGLSGKKIMKDVSVVPRVMNPIDELKYMDLITFRRLGQNINEIIEKINTKIKLLEEDQYSKRMEGIKAWRNSPVNRLYLTIGEESISKNMTVNAIIEDRQKQNKDCLTNEEFEAVMDLNKSLRF